ncbi:MAG: hypothetical protein Tsb0020_50700 [Haliangiales bacterium]
MTAPGPIRYLAGVSSDPPRREAADDPAAANPGASAESAAASAAPPRGAEFERVLADRDRCARMLRRIAHEIVERNRGSQRLALVGIRTGGLHLAKHLQRLIGEIEAAPPPCGAIDISLYRDDIFQGLPRPVIGPTELPFELSGVVVVLVDDVLYTGRTVRAALDALMDYGRPRAVELVALVDRGLRELPIRADYTGMKAETVPEQVVKVRFTEDDEVDEVHLLRRRAGAAGADT